MPCRTDIPDSVERELNRVEAMLCAVLRVIEKYDSLDQVLHAIDFAEAGIQKRDLLEWWKHHKALDDRRRKEEEKQRLRDAAREVALNKLTPYEKELLGF